ncbi:alpha/beta fold hydrolase [Amycolatopsis rhabdoformis]|uniref:Alpha/beta fold hydrolase n=1 Tax=Amycolatopsis rhabdoformis TaxID=1448059 RepID=A0ABZ1I3Q0_9PSEU|nr:alpha/beta fold hydrolase [Amycolatopsis rhabdoformis]WSE28412.1 alpha/beta fold hydrolase [Amycolatopsis rhabdoformis]
MDYAQPQGRKINVAVSRRKAADPAKRRGVLVANLGGPGLGNIEDPGAFSTMGLAAVADDYDVVGFDMRGTGYSDKINCEWQDGPSVPVTASAKEKAKAGFATYTEFNKRCTAIDPAFVKQLTTSNTARDLDSLRAALGAPKISFYGVSYGTAIGAVYRSMFDSHVDRMWLDSVMPPVMDLSTMDGSRDAVSEKRFGQLVTWLAQHDAEYHFGTTANAVHSALFTLRDQLVQHPRVIDDTTVLDGQWARGQFAMPENAWAAAADDLATVRDGGVPASAHPAAGARQLFGFDADPHGLNSVQYNAMFCNEGTGGRDFEQVWSQVQAHQREYPATGGAFEIAGFCGGWPFPAQPWKPVKGSSAFEVSGHLDEADTPYAWAVDTQKAAGGALLTVLDGQHASLDKIPCGQKAVDFFRTGRTVSGSCRGIR